MIELISTPVQGGTNVDLIAVIIAGIALIISGIALILHWKIMKDDNIINYYNSVIQLMKEFQDMDHEQRHIIYNKLLREKYFKGNNEFQEYFEKMLIH
jgi:hypothetical protein